MSRSGGPSALWLAAVAMGAAVLNQLFWLLPLALMLGIPALWWGNAFIAGLALAAFLLLAWVLQPRQPDPPDELQPEDAPELYARAHALADALQAPRVHAIALDDELNAGALELNRGVSLRPVRRVLVLGRPLLAALDGAAVEAVIAHELGHFSRQHGRLGHWLYNTRQSWAALAQLDDGTPADADSSPWERAAAQVAQGFLPWFDRLSLAHMRRCEFEADALAARVCGPDVLARALMLLASLHEGRARSGSLLRRQLMRAHAEPPADLLAREAAAWREAAEAWGPPAPDDETQQGTHPPLPQRLAALGVAPAAPDWPTRSAGAEWLGELWPPALGGRNDAIARLHWAVTHGLLHALVLGADATPARRLQLALAWGEPVPPQAAATTPAEQLLQAQAELRAGRRDAARALLEACREHKTAERDVATAWLVEHGLGTDLAQRRRYQGWLRQVRARREAALEDLAAAREQGRIDAAPLGAADCEALAQAWRAHPAVSEAWLFGQAVTAQQVSYQAVVMLLRLDPQRLAGLGLQDDDVADLARELLAAVSPPGCLCLVLSRYTTEGLPPALAQALVARGASRLR